MSTTTTTTRATTATTAEIQHILSDYEIHLTGSESGAPTQPANPYQDQSPTTGNPQNWLRSYRRVPDYRPINRNLDYNERTMGSNAFEFLFLNVMFTGVALNASIAKLWGQTGGKVFTRVFRYAIGGEW